MALLPNMLLRAPSTEERLMSTRQKIDSRFSKFFAGDFDGLLKGIPQSSVRAYELHGLRPPEHTSIWQKFKKKGPFAEPTP